MYAVPNAFVSALSALFVVFGLLALKRRVKRYLTH
jgi:hypothetical protein